MKVRKIILFAIILLAGLMFTTKVEASYQSRNVVISSPESGSIQQVGKNVKVEYTVYDVYMNVLNNELITHAEISYYKDGKLLDSGNLGYIWKRGDWFKGGIEFYTYGGGEYMVDITCIPMNAMTYEVDDRISPSMYPAKTIKFYIYEDKEPSAEFENTSISKQVGDSPFTNKLNTSSDGDVEYSSSNTNVAKVNQSTGEVTVVGSGSATITAKVNRSYVYKDIAKTYTINVTGEGSANTNNNNSPSKEKQKPMLEFENSNIKKKLGDSSFTNKLKTNTDGKIIYTSGNSLIAKVDKNTGEVTVVGTGMVAIVATAFETDNYQKATAVYTVTVASAVPSTPTEKEPTTQEPSNGQQPIAEKKTPTLKFASANISKKTGDASFTNKLTADTDGKIIYTSGNTLVAKVDKNTGRITIVGAGMTTIVATAFETDNYKKGTATYTIKVTKPTTATATSTTTNTSTPKPATQATPTPTTKPTTSVTSTPKPSTPTPTVKPSPTPTPKASPTPTTKPSSSSSLVGTKTPTIKFASSTVNKKTGDASFTNKLTCDSDGLITYTSSNKSVATINGSTGVITIKGVGATTITATSKATSTYKAGKATFTLTVTKGSNGNVSVVTKKDAVLAFSNTSMTYYMNNMNRNPIYLTVTKTQTDGAITYSSSDESIVKIDSKTGKISLAGIGTARIYARSAETSNYKAGEGYCDVTVKRN